MTQSSTRLADELPPCDYRPAVYDGPSRQQVLIDRQRFCNPAIFTLYSEPLMIVEGHLQYLFDETGRRYLDMLAGISTVSCGHCHPQVTERVSRQLQRLQHASTIYLHPNFSELAAKLAARLPGDLEVTYFTNSGSEANDLAVHLARLYTGCLDIVAVRSGYHGGSFGSMGLTGVYTWKYPSAQGTCIYHTICPDPYRSPFNGTAEEIAEKSVQDMEQVILSSTSGQIAGFLAEPIQGVGGVTHGAPNYLRGAYDLVRRHGGLCIADEVQTGFGRTGKYWGFEHFDVEPDIVTMAKAFGNGMPLGAVTTRREIAEKLAQKLHFNTFGGNPGLNGGRQCRAGRDRSGEPGGERPPTGRETQEGPAGSAAKASIDWRCSGERPDAGRGTGPGPGVQRAGPQRNSGAARSHLPPAGSFWQRGALRECAPAQTTSVSNGSRH